MTNTSNTPAKARIVALAPNDWVGPWMNRQHLLSRLSGAYPITYSCGAWTNWDRKSVKYESAPWFGRFEVRNGVLVDFPGRVLTRFPGVPMLDNAICKAEAIRWRRTQSDADGPLVAYLFHPQYRRYVDVLNADYLVYHAYDLFRSMDGENSGVVEEENWLLDRADLVIATSEETARDFQTRTTREVRVLGNGVDWDQFAATPTECPAELARIPHPRIGYVGAINRKVDFELMLELARREPSWNFVLVGGVRQIFPTDQGSLDQLKRLANVHILPEIAQSGVPAMLRGLDVGLVCYRLLGWTIAGFPLKMLEYLAAGIPVVSADIAAVHRFQHVLAIARSVEEWQAHIRAALAGAGPGDKEQRQAVARSNSWDARAAELGALLKQTLSGPGRQWSRR